MILPANLKICTLHGKCLPKKLQPTKHLLSIPSHKRGCRGISGNAVHGFSPPCYSGPIMKTLKLSETEIEQAVKRAINRIPSEIRRHLKNIVISVQKRPSKEILQEMGLHRNEPLLGIYRGTA